MNDDPLSQVTLTSNLTLTLHVLIFSSLSQSLGIMAKQLLAGQEMMPLCNKLALAEPNEAFSYKFWGEAYMMNLSSN